MGLLTAIQTSGLRGVAVSESAPDAARVAPDYLSEVAPSVLVVRVVPGVLGLLVVPTVNNTTGKVDPHIVVLRGRVNPTKVATAAVLLVLALRRK
jgi:hypothetical protein